jgi:predicted SnoaL-like aldol condensation-catalyzing enzyme
MNITKPIAVCFCCIFIYAAAKSKPVMDTLSNKQKVLLFYKLIVGQRKAELIPEFVREDYKQHNPLVKQGRAGLTEMINYLKTLPLPPATAQSPVIRAVQEGDFVVTHLDLVFMGQRKIVIDLFKLKDGMLAEHWDVMQDMPGQSGQSVTATNGTSQIDKTASASHSKRIVQLFYEGIISKKGGAEFVQKDYAEHDPEVIRSGKGLVQYLTDDPDREVKIHRMIGEGDFVVVQSEYKKRDNSFALYEIFRVEKDQIAERWSVEMQIPDKVVEAGGMF